MGPHETAYFSPTQFLEDTQSTAAAIGAPYSEATTLKVLETYAQSFRDGAVLWRSTDRPGDALNYRFYERKPVDTVSIAVQAGLLAPDNPMIELIQSWSSLYDGAGTPEQSCDFDAKSGLVSSQSFLNKMPFMPRFEAMVVFVKYTLSIAATSFPDSIILYRNIC